MSGGSIVFRLSVAGSHPPVPPTPELLADIAQLGGTAVPLFTPAAVSLSTSLRAHNSDAPDLSRYWRVESPGARTDLDEANALFERLVQNTRLRAEVDAFYVSPFPRPAAVSGTWADPLDRFQGYLDSADAGGVGARRVWRDRGGTGSGVRVADVESSWNPEHEGLRGVQWIDDQAPVGGWASHDWCHGTSALGVLGARPSGRGMLGICHEASLLFSTMHLPGYSGPNEAAAIAAAAVHLSPGDILLVEVEKQVPVTEPFNPAASAHAPVEWYPENFNAIRLATEKGIIVVEAAGNSGIELDDARLDARLARFPREWVNPFRRTAWDCGAVIVGAGIAPGNFVRPPGVSPRCRSLLSNFGTCVDAQGWDGFIATCGKSSPTAAPRWGTGPNDCYWDAFSATSGASAMVAGVLACAQGLRIARGMAPMDPPRARAKLRAGGRAQTGNVAERIGSLPDLEEALWTT